MDIAASPVWNTVDAIDPALMPRLQTSSTLPHTRDLSSPSFPSPTLLCTLTWLKGSKQRSGQNHCFLILSSPRCPVLSLLWRHHIKDSWFHNPQDEEDDASLLAAQARLSHMPWQKAGPSTEPEKERGGSLGLRPLFTREARRMGPEGYDPRPLGKAGGIRWHLFREQLANCQIKRWRRRKTGQREVCFEQLSSVCGLADLRN